MTAAKRPTARERSGKGKPVDPPNMAWTVKLRPPGEERQHEIVIDLLGFTLNERQVVKRALAQFTDPDIVEVQAVHAWVVWRREHPDVELGDWIDGITFGQLIGVDDEALKVPWQTPEDFRPEA